MDYLPNTSQGYLPVFVFIVGITAITNAFQCYRDISYLQRIYNPPVPSHAVSVKTTNITRAVVEDTTTPPPGSQRPSVTAIATAESTSPVTPLSARTFGTYNLAVGIVRLYAAYHLTEKSWYQMSIWTNVVGMAHFGLEALVYKTAQPQGPWLAPVLTALVGLVWHVVQMDHYVK